MQSKTIPLHCVQPKQDQILDIHALVISPAQFIGMKSKKGFNKKGSAETKGKRELEIVYRSKYAEAARRMG